MRATLLIGAGQTIWAVSQAALIIFLAQKASLEFVGYVTAAFAVFAPLALLMSLNLRTNIAIGAIGNGEATSLLTIRLATSFGAFLASAIAVYFLGADGVLFMGALALLVLRYADTVADLSIGYYQRDQVPRKIFLSLAARGLSVFLAMMLALWFEFNLLVFCLLTSAAYSISVVLFDLNYALSKPTTSMEHGNIQRLSQAFASALSKWKSALFPAFDNIHQNSLRFGALLLYDIKTVGMVGLALTAYAPIQLLITAIGMKTLPELRNFYLAQRSAKFVSLTQKTVGLGLVISIAAIMIAIAVPTALYEVVYNVPGVQARNATIAIGVAHLLLPASGFLAQSLVSSDKADLYLLGPIVSVFCFWVFLGGAQYWSSVSFFQLSGLVLVSGLPRLIIGITGLKTRAAQIE